MTSLKVFVVLILGLSAAGICSAISQNEIFQLLELNSMFDVIHKNYDNQINLKWEVQKHNMKVLNAQFLSRYGFTVDATKVREAEVLAAIDARGVEIGNPDSECLNVTRWSLAQAVDYASMNYGATLQEILFYFNDISEHFFYPLVEVLHQQSNEIQWEVLYALQHVNPVTNMSGLIQRLRDDYYVLILLYENAIQNLADEIVRYNSEFNVVRGSTFHTFQNVLSYFSFTASILIDALPACE